MKQIVLPAALLLFESLPLFKRFFSYLTLVLLVTSSGAGWGPSEMTAPAGRSRVMEVFKGPVYSV